MSGTGKVGSWNMCSIFSLVLLLPQRLYDQCPLVRSTSFVLAWSILFSCAGFVDSSLRRRTSIPGESGKTPPCHNHKHHCIYDDDDDDDDVDDDEDDDDDEDEDKDDDDEDDD